MKASTISNFGRALWSVRLVMIVPVVASIVIGLILIITASIDVIRLVGQIPQYAQPEVSIRGSLTLHSMLVAKAASIVDSYLFASVAFIFGFGLYELFVGKIVVPEKDGMARHILLINDIDDLKERLARVVLLMLIVRYFQFALEQASNQSQELLFLAIGIVLIAAAVFLTRRSS